MPLGTRLRTLFVLLAITLTATANAETYWRITYDRVTVITNGNAERCTRLATPKLGKPLPQPAKLETAEAERLLQVLSLRAKRATPDPM